MMIVMLSGAKHLTVGMCFYRHQPNVNEAKMIELGSKILYSDEKSVAPLGMTNNKVKDLTTR
jgi:hypothetical protein